MEIKENETPKSLVGNEIIYTSNSDIATEDDFEVRIGDKIAQVLIQPVESVEIEEVDELSETSRGEGGFGSTGGSRI